MQTLPNRCLRMNPAVAQSIVHPRPDSQMQTTMRSSLLPSVSVALLALTAPSVPASAQSRDGWTYTTITIDSGKAGSRVSRRVRYRMAGTAYRTDDLPMSGSAAGTVDSVYEIFNRGDSTMTMVMPLIQMAWVMGRNSFPRLNSNLVPKFVRRLTKKQFEDLGAGEKILGHATRHVRVTSVGTIETTMMGQTCTQPVDEVWETWVAPDVDLPPADADPFESSIIIGLDSIGVQVELADKNMPKGAALRTIRRSVEPDSTGKPITETTTTELVDLTFGPLDASIFAVPGDFQTIDARSAGTMDSTMKADVASRIARPFCRGGWRPASPQ
jgi:hypothetical protein